MLTGIPVRDRPPAIPSHRRSDIPKTGFGRPDSRAAATDRSPCRRRHGDACPATGFPIAGQLNRMGRRFKRHRPSGYPRFLYPHTLHSQRSPTSFTALAHSTSAFLPPLHRVLALRKAGFVNRFIKPMHTPHRSEGDGRTGASCSQSTQSLQGTMPEGTECIISARISRVKTLNKIYFTSC